MRSTKDPFNVDPPSGVTKISRAGKNSKDGDYIVEKFFEDNGSVLPGSTIAVHDSQTGKVFLGGAMSPFITICETR